MTDQQQTPATTETGSSLVMIGGAVILGVWLLFEVLTDDYGISIMATVLAAVAVLLPRTTWTDQLAPKAALVKAVGYLLALTGAVEFVFDIESGSLDGFLTIVAALIAYAGYVLAYLGARSTSV